jgi:hypothetical protein
MNLFPECTIQTLCNGGKEMKGRAIEEAHKEAEVTATEKKEHAHEVIEQLAPAQLSALAGLLETMVRKQVYEEPFDWSTAPTRPLLAAARKRNQENREKFGPYGSLKNLKPCRNCGKMIGSGEYRRHRVRGRWLCAPGRKKLWARPLIPD